jgi:5-aminopentanamidase
MTLSVAAFQMPLPSDERLLNLEMIQQKLRWAETQEIQLAVFPECFLTGYFTNASDATRVSLELQSDEFQDVLEQFERYNCTVLLGLIERQGNNLFNTAAVISSGNLIGVYRKTHPNEKCFAAGREYPVFDVQNTKLGINICFDANFPEAAARVAQAGAKMIVYPLNNFLPEETAMRWREKSTENLRLRARETGCYVVSADVAGRNGSSLSYGCTQMIDPAGELLSSVPELETGVITASIEI